MALHGTIRMMLYKVSYDPNLYKKLKLFIQYERHRVKPYKLNIYFYWNNARTNMCFFKQPYPYLVEEHSIGVDQVEEEVV